MSEWISNKGNTLGVHPVDDDVEVKVVLSNGESESGVAGQFEWSCDMGDFAITAYSVVTPVTNYGVDWTNNTGYTPVISSDVLVDVKIKDEDDWGFKIGNIYDFQWSMPYLRGNVTEWRLHDVGKGTKQVTTKSTNPKDAIGSSKLPLHLWPASATMTGTLGLLDGTLKYGRANWRVAGVRASIYIDAVLRHVNAYREGETNDPDSGVPHLGHALACLAILVDSEAAGKLNDDRNIEGGYRALVERLTPHVERIKELHKGKSPKHYSIADNIEAT